MRNDAIGFFWQDVPIEKPPKAEKIKRQAPKATWLHADYLPGLYEALAFKVEMFSDFELYQARGRRLVLDVECYTNFFQVSFRCPLTDKVAHFELSEVTNFSMDYGKLEWVLHNFTIVTFNGNSYDVPITTLALRGFTTDQLKWASQEIIVMGTRPYELLRSCKVKKLAIDHIDLFEVAPLQGSLKKYGARLHVPRMQDLPFPPDTILTKDQAAIVRWYCVNSDLPATIRLLKHLEEQIALRIVMSHEYDVDLRSKSDAQVAEAVISNEIVRLQGGRLKPPEILPGTVYYYQVPAFLQYRTPVMQWVLERVRTTPLIVGPHGSINLPEELENLKIPIAYGLYRMGVGGLHSSESAIMHTADDTFDLKDVDVESFYPRIILNQSLYPKHLGPVFLRVYEAIVSRRVHAKRESKKCKEAGDKAGEARWKVIADSLKITINGTFGKLGNMFSVIYAPDLLIQVTLSGQLSLLMLIERLELECIHIVSANTDGIVMRVPKDKHDAYVNVVKQWERDTGYTTEETEYERVLSRDVNNYIAIKKGGETKNKGTFANPWKKPGDIEQLKKNPVNLICTTAIEKYVIERIPYEKTIRECRDITQFVTVRDAKGGGVKIDNEGDTVQFMGKMLRWYYAVAEEGEIVYARNGNRVANSKGAKPLMDLPEVFPEDVDYERYISITEEMLEDVGYT